MPTQIWRFFFRLAPPPTEFANEAPPENFRFGPLQAILREKRGSIFQGLQLVEYSFNQTLAYIMEGDRGAGGGTGGIKGGHKRLLRVREV